MQMEEIGNAPRETLNSLNLQALVVWGTKEKRGRSWKQDLRGGTEALMGQGNSRGGQVTKGRGNPTGQKLPATTGWQKSLKLRYFRLTSLRLAS